MDSERIFIIGGVIGGLTSAMAPRRDGHRVTVIEKDPNWSVYARAWSWRRRLERGEASTILDTAQAEGVTDRFVSRMIRPAWLSPAVLEKPVLERCSPAVSIKDLIAAGELPWVEEETVVFG
jgi:monoamine oxidase